MVLGFVALASQRPWEAASADPHLSLALGAGAVGGAVAVTPERPSRPAGTGGESLARAVPVASPVPARDGSAPTLAVAQGRAVDVVATLPPPPSAPEPPASVQPPPAPEALPPAQTVVAGGGNGGGGPSTAVVEVEPKPGCEGDEYEVTIGFVAEAIPSDEAEVEIAIRRVGRDGSESEIQLEGQFGDVGELLEQVISHDDCVAVRVEPAGGEESGGDFSEPAMATASAAEELEPVLP